MPAMICYLIIGVLVAGYVVGAIGFFMRFRLVRVPETRTVTIYRTEIQRRISQVTEDGNDKNDRRIRFMSEFLVFTVVVIAAVVSILAVAGVIEVSWVG